MSNSLLFEIQSSIFLYAYFVLETTYSIPLTVSEWKIRLKWCGDLVHYSIS